MTTGTKTIGQILAEESVVLPGSDLGKTSVYLIFPLVLLAVLADNPFFNAQLDSIKAYRDISTLLLILSMALAVVSGKSARDALDSQPAEIKWYTSLFFGKLLIASSVLVFFVVVCLWVVLLGGIMSSPFASLLSMSPMVILLDEPTSNLDSRNRRQVIDILKRAPQTLVVTSHDLEFLLEICPRVLLIDQGRLYADGPIQQVLADQALLQAHGLEKPHSLVLHRHIGAAHPA